MLMYWQPDWHSWVRGAKFQCGGSDGGQKRNARALRRGQILRACDLRFAPPHPLPKIMTAPLKRNTKITEVSGIKIADAIKWQ